MALKPSSNRSVESRHPSVDVPLSEIATWLVTKPYTEYSSSRDLLEGVGATKGQV